MAFGGQNPGLWGESVRKALNPGEVRDARAQATGAEQAAIDEAELRDLERSGSYGVRPGTPRPTGLRGVVDRLFHRSR